MAGIRVNNVVETNKQGRPALTPRFLARLWEVQTQWRYDIDGRLTPDSVFRMRIPAQRRRTIGQYGGQLLAVRSSNPVIVPNDGFGETQCRVEGLRFLSLLGQAAGTTVIEARQGSNGPSCTLEAVVVAGDPSASPVADNRSGSAVWEVTGADAPLFGSIPFAAGAAMPSVVRIPVPGTNGLAVELSPRGRVPAGGSTSTIFIQDVTQRSKN